MPRLACQARGKLQLPGQLPIFSRKCNGPHGALDAVVVRFDASVFEEPLETIQMV